MSRLLKTFIREALRSRNTASMERKALILREFPEAKCPGCGLQMQAGKKFCKECGTKLGECPACKAALTNSETQKFCRECGEKIPGAFAQNPDNSGEVDKQQQNLKKLEDIIQASNKGFELAKKRTDASSQFNAAMSAYHKSQFELMNAYQSNSKEKIEAAKEKYQIAKEKFISASDEDDDAFSVWFSHMEKSGVPMPPDLKKAGASGGSARESTKETDEMIKKFDALAQKAESKLKDAVSLKKLKFTGDEKKDSVILHNFLKKSKSLDNKVYLAFIIGHYREHNPQIAFSLRSAWRESDGVQVDAKKPEDDFSIETLNLILDNVGGAVATFKR